MLPDPDALAEIVVQTVHDALTPVLERMAAAEARLAMLGDVRDRVLVVETKAALPGEPRERGPEGPAGPPGRDGAQGEKGINGQPGMAGERGPEGPEGQPGQRGRDGSSFTFGIGPPTVDGLSGDAYLDVKTGDVYQCR